MEINYNKIGFRISQRRRELKLRQCDLAEMIGVTTNHISNIEKGNSSPSIETLINICNSMQVTPDYIMLGSIRADINENIVDDLKLCSLQDKKIISKIVELYVDNGKK